jgi:uncharacterized delta-60 repeat protein
VCLLVRLRIEPEYLQGANSSQPPGAAPGERPPDGKFLAWRIASSFVDGTISFGATVSAFSFQPDGKVLIVASYANASLQPTLQLYRLGVNGGLDSTFAQGAGTPAVPAGLRHCLLSNGQILLSGGSGVYNGATVNSNLFRLNADGSIDKAYAGYVLGLVNVGGLVGGFTPAPNGRIYFYGAFDKVGGQSLLGLGRLHPDGTLDTSFVPAIPASPSRLVLQPDDRLLLTHLVVSPQVGFVISRLNGSTSNTVFTPQIGPITLLKNGLVQMPVTGGASQVIVQSSPNLTAWSNLSTNPVVNGLISFTDKYLGSSRAQFYKLLVVP